MASASRSSRASSPSAPSTWGSSARDTPPTRWACSGTTTSPPRCTRARSCWDGPSTGEPVSGTGLPLAGAPPVLESHAGWVRARWHALGGPCELLVDGADTTHAAELARDAAGESWRIERKFSRYRDDRVLHAIHTAHGHAVTVDDETAQLLDYAAECHAVSEGRFDITSGVLRRVWTFDGGSRVPDAAAIARVLPLVGWGRVTWRRPQLVLPEGMELDLG